VSIQTQPTRRQEATVAFKPIPCSNPDNQTTTISQRERTTAMNDTHKAPAAEAAGTKSSDSGSRNTRREFLAGAAVAGRQGQPEKGLIL
jgi:hypothetical protein